MSNTTRLKRNELSSLIEILPEETRLKVISGAIPSIETTMEIEEDDGSTSTIRCRNVRTEDLERN